MDQKNWKTWLAVALLVVAAFAIYTTASPDKGREPLGGTVTPVTQVAATKNNARTRGPAAPPGVAPLQLELLEAESGSYKSDRNIFAYREPPPPKPPPPVVVAPPAPPPDDDKDGVPNFRDNCPTTVNPDQQDVDRDGIGTACETEPETPPPPPAPVPPPFTFKYIGTFGRAQNPIATFAREGEIVNARVGDVIEGKFILRRIGLESAEIGFVGFPPDQVQRVPLGQ